MQAQPREGKISMVQTVSSGDPPQACEFLALHAGLPKARVKDAMNKGAVWLQRKSLGRIRLRKATFILRKGDQLELHYDPQILAQEAPAAFCLQDHRYYSVWFKPANLLTQGTDFGDHGSLVRQVQVYFHSKREVYLVHRLDREAEGLIMVAHTKQAAGKLSRLFAEHGVCKRYRVEVLGIPGQDESVITEPLDGKTAITRYRVMSRSHRTATLFVEIETGRLHQIRRHLAGVGHPVMGDPRYGTGNKDRKPMRLSACELGWRCPFTGAQRIAALKFEEVHR